MLCECDIFIERLQHQSYFESSPGIYKQAISQPGRELNIYCSSFWKLRKLILNLNKPVFIIAIMFFHRSPCVSTKFRRLQVKLPLS